MVGTVARAGKRGKVPRKGRLVGEWIPRINRNH